MRSLKKQAREANRYKSLSEEIRNAQSIVLAVKYQVVNEQLIESKKQFTEAVKNHQETIRGVASLNSEEINFIMDKIIKFVIAFIVIGTVVHFVINDDPLNFDWAFECKKTLATVGC